MEAIEFLGLVLPSQGPYHIRWFKGEKGPAKGTLYLDTIEQVAEEAVKLDAKGFTVYYGTANYVKKNAKSDAANVLAKQCFYLDLDVGKGKEYPDRRSALASLVKVREALDLPEPIIVSSGYGFHCYWPLSAPMPRDEWVNAAIKFKANIKHLGIKCDTKVTADAARILRVPGTTNRKYDREANVIVAKADYTLLTPDVFGEKVGAEKFDPLANIDPNLANMFAPDTSLVVEAEYAPSDADSVAKHCNFIKAFKATGFDEAGTEPEWYDALGVVKHCIDGEAKCHEYSAVAGEEIYDEGITQDKIEQWEKGPTTCEHIRSNYDYCDGCTHQCTSPIQLGEHEAAIEQLKSQGSDIDGPWWPKGVGWDEAKGQMYREVRVQNEDGDWVNDRIHFSSTKFYVETRIWTDDGTWAFRVHRLKYLKVLDDGAKKEMWETFTVPTKEVARPTDLAMTFAAKEIYVNGTSGNRDLSEVLKQYGDALRLRQVETKTHGVMGWYSHNEDLDMHSPTYPLHADSFIIGNRLITKDGEEEILLSDKVKDKWRKGFGVAGTASEWAKTIHEYYVKTKAIPYQFIILTEFAAPLVSLFCRSEYHGNPIIISGESGWAKTTTSKMAASIWGNPELLLVSGNPKAGATSLSFMKTLSVLRHISPLLDEVTKQQAHIVGEIIYAIAMGASRERVGIGGNPLPADSPWSSITKITSNNPIMQRVIEDEADSVEAGDAIQKRIFEVNLDRLPYNRHDFVGDENVGAAIDKFMSLNHGTAGPIWIRYIMQNFDAIVAELDAEYLAAKKRAADHAAERFHDYFEAALLVACKHVSKANLMFPDVAGIKEFIHHVREDMASIRDDSKLPMLDGFARYLGQQQGGLLVTDKFPIGKGRPESNEYPKKDLHGELVGRIALKDHVAALAISPLKDWCKSRSIDFTKLVKELDAAGYFAHDPELLKSNKNKPEPMKTATARLSLGRGTSVISSRTKCLMMDFGRIANKTHLRDVNTDSGDVDEQAN